KVIDLTAAKSGLITVDDPASLIHLGYGFDHPSPGPWRVTLSATASTPPGGADFALLARVRGGATLAAKTNELTPTIGEPVEIDADVEAAQLVTISDATALIRSPDGRRQEIPLTVRGHTATLTWEPQTDGLHSIDVVVTGQSGTRHLERVAFLAVDVQAAATAAGSLTTISIAGAAILVVLFGGLYLLWRRPRGRRSRHA
ncbi:MAG TPA: hypothetical protein VFI00_17455, partial [Kribbella sp.]|nr:hypothetical protein [Kribbella sp.]